MKDKQYPRKEDLEKHKEQFVKSLRQYFLFKGNISMVKNGLRTLFTDLILECNNNQNYIYGEMNFDKFLQELMTPNAKK